MLCEKISERRCFVKDYQEQKAEAKGRYKGGVSPRVERADREAEAQ